MGKKARLSFPDGTYEILNIPEGASKQDIDKQVRLRQAKWQVDNDKISKGARDAKEGRDIGLWETIFIGAGRTFDKAAKGLEQKFYELTDDKEELARMQADEAASDVAISKLRDKHPVGMLLGEVLPYMAIPGARTAKGAAALGAGTGFVMYTPEGESSVLNSGEAAVAAIAGFALSKLVTNVISPSIKSQLSGAQKQVVSRAKELGAKTTPSGEFGSKALERFEKHLDQFPPTANILRKYTEENQKILNRVVAQAIGENADDVTSNVIDAAFERTGNVFNKVKAIKRIPTKTLANHIARLEANSAVPDAVSNNPLFREAMDKVAKGNMSGEQMSSLISRIGRRAAQEMRTAAGNRELGSDLFQLKELLDDAVDVVMPSALRAERATARQQYRALMTIIKGSVVDEVSGNVNGKVLAGVLKRTDRAGMLRGKNVSDMYTMARFAKTNPIHTGTVRTSSSSLAGSEVASGLGGAIFGELATGNPIIGGAVGLSIPVIARGAAYAYARSTPYLQNKLLGDTSKIVLQSLGSKAALGWEQSKEQQ